MKNILFSDCDIIHDKGRECALRIYHCDSALVSHVRFENIRVEESRQLISLWIGKKIWSKDAERGNIQNVVFDRIHATAHSPRCKIELQSYDNSHKIKDVLLKDVTIDSIPLVLTDIVSNSYVEELRVQP